MPAYDDPPSTLAEMLNGYMVDGLKNLAHALLGVKKGRKQELIDAIVRRLQGEALHATWQRLSEAQQAAVSEAVHHVGFGPDLDWGRFGDKYASTFGAQRTSRREVYQGLLPLLMDPRGYVPRDLKAELRRFVPSPPNASVETLGEAPESDAFGDPLTRVDTARRALLDLKAMLTLIDAGRLRVSAKTGRGTKSSLETITEILDGGDWYAAGTPGAQGEPPFDPIKAFAWPLLVQAGGLARAEGTQLQLTRLGRKALGAPPHETIRAIYERWVASRLIDEFSRIEVIKGQQAKRGRHMTAAHERRAAIHAGLRRCPLGQWIPIDEFFRFLRASGHDFEVTRDPWNLYIGDHEYGSLGYNGYHPWALLQGRYVMAVLFEYAATLGLIDAVYSEADGARDDFGHIGGTDELDAISRYDGLRCFRVNELGAYCLGQTNRFTLPESKAATPFTVLATGEIAVTSEPLAAADQLLLARFARQTSDAVWSLDRDSVLAAIEIGLPLQDIRSFLQSGSAERLPQTVARMLDDVGERAGRIADGGAARLIEVSDPALALELANDRTLRRHCLLAGERCLVVPERSEAAFRSRLKKLGYVLSS